MTLEIMKSPIHVHWNNWKHMFRHVLSLPILTLGLQVPNIRLLAQLVASDPSFTAVATGASTPMKALEPLSIPEPIPGSE
jgi:hypothetical protein